MGQTIGRTTISVTTAGGAGVATGSADSDGVVRGYIHAIHVNTSFAQATDTTDITVSTKTAPTQTILTLTDVDSADNGWYYPVAEAVDNTNTVIDYVPFLASDYLTCDVAQGDNGTVVLTILYEVLT